MATETLRPDAAGDECNILYEVGATCPNHYQNVDEEVSDEFTSYVKDSDLTTYHRDLYNLDDSAGSGDINFIKVYAHCKQASVSPNQDSLKIAIKSGTGSGAPDTPSESSEITPSNAWTLYSNQWNTNPATSAAWTWDEIDKLQAGIAIRASKSDEITDTYVTQVYVEVDYTRTTRGWMSK